MKSQFARFKNRARSVSARTLALVLCFVMLVTAVSAGAVIDSSNAVNGYSNAGSAVADGVDKIADFADDSADNDNSIAEDGFFPTVKNRVKELALTGGKSDLATTGSIDNFDYVQVYLRATDSNNGYLQPDNTNYNWWSLNYNDGDYAASFRVKTATTGGNPYWYYFYFFIGKNNGWNNKYYAWNYTFNSGYDGDNTGAPLNNQGSNTTNYDHVEVAASETGYAFIDFQVSTSNEKFWVKQRPINNLAASYSDETIAPRSTKSVWPTITGGTGTYSVSYSLTKNGVSVGTLTDYINNDNFYTTEPGTYEVTATVTDSNISDLTAATATKTITVVTPDFHIVGLHDYGGTSVTSSNIMTGPDANGDYKIAVDMDTDLTGSDGDHNSKFHLVATQTGQNVSLQHYGPNGASSDYHIDEDHFDVDVTMDDQNTHWFANYYTEGSGHYIIAYNLGTNKLRISENTAGFYIPNNATLTTSSNDMDDPDAKMTLSAGTLYTKTFTGVGGGSATNVSFQVSDGTTAQTISSAAGNVMPSLASNTITFTLGATETSWTVTVTYNDDTGAVTVNALEAAAEEETSGWKYTADNTDATPEIEGTPSNSWGFAYGTNNSNQADITHFKGAVVSSTNYWADISDVALDGIYLGLTNAGNSAGIQGSTSSIGINGASKGYNSNNSSSNQVAFSESGTSLFTVEVKQHGSVASNKLYIQIHSVNKTKVSGIGVKAVYSGSGAVDYYFYYKTVGGGGGGSSTHQFMVYAKDGTITETNYGFAKYATTTISDTLSTTYTQTTSDSDGEYYYTGSFALNEASTTTLTVTTTVNADNKAKLYVKGWSVNGTTYGYNASDTIQSDTGAYSFTLTVNYDDFKDAPIKSSKRVIEITPIYYLKDATTVSFRVENFDKDVQNSGTNQSGWGSTLFAYPYYGALSNVDNSFGAYPGQPLIYYQGKYSIQIPIESISLNSPTTDGKIVRGITLNNGYFDNAHKDVYGWSGTAQHKQTYDFDDFHKIFNEKGANDIIFRFKYRPQSTAYNRDTYFSSAKTDLSAADISALASDKGWEVLRDRAGRIIDIFGNPILRSGSDSEYATETSHITNFDTTKLYVVSMGYFDNSAGEYATEWVIFGNDGDGTGTRIEKSSSKYCIVPSALILNENTRFSTSVYTTYRNKPIDYYKDMYDVLNSTETAKGKPAVIAYEQEHEKSNNAFRCDGRWYYTTSSDFVKSSIKIQYKTPAGVYVNDTYTTNNDDDVTGVTTGAKAYFTNTAYENKRVSKSEIYSAADKDKYIFEAVDGENYQFAGWFLEVDGDTDKPTYTPINPDADGHYSVARTSSDVLVARFDPIKAGTVKIQHNLGTGTGTVDVKVEYGTAGSYTTLRNFGTAAGTVSFTVSSAYIKATNRSKNIKITLQSNAGTDNSFSAYSASEGTLAESEYFPDATGTTVGTQTTKEITISIGSLLDNNTTSLTYISNFTAPTYKYEITYNYTSTRLKTSGGANATVSYTSKGEFTPKAYANNVEIAGEARTLKDSFILDAAPHESNFKQILTLSGVTPSVNTFTHDEGTNTYTQTATVTFSARDDKSVTAIIDLPYQYTFGTGSGEGDTAYAAHATYKDYTTTDHYCTLPGVSDSDVDEVEGVLEDDSSEPFNLNTIYGGYFVTSDNKSININNDANKRYIIKAPQTIIGGKLKADIVTKYTIHTNRVSGQPMTWDDLAEDTTAYENEMIRLLGVENLADTEANRNFVIEKYTHDDYKVYRIDEERPYIPDEEHPIKYFQYWSIKNMDNVEVTRCYFLELNYLAFENCRISPVYGNSPWTTPSDVSTSISYMGVSRNQWNNNGGSSVATSGTYGLMAGGDSTAADYIWADFALDFRYADYQLNDYSGDDIVAMGVVVQKAGPRVGTESSSSYYQSYYQSTEDRDDVIKKLKNKYLSETNVVAGKYSVKAVNRSNLNNKNREDYFLRVCNSYGWNDATNQPTNVDANYSGSAMRVYSFIIVGTTVYVSKRPAYFCTYGIANE